MFTRNPGQLMHEDVYNLQSNSRCYLCFSVNKRPLLPLASQTTLCCNLEVHMDIFMILRLLCTLGIVVVSLRTSSSRRQESRKRQSGELVLIIK